MSETYRGYPVCTRTFTIAGRDWRVLGPANYETLIDDPRVVARFERDEFMPYWAEFWPASLLLADAVAAWEPAAGDVRPVVLEFGCGLGLISLIAAERGYRVIASDYDDDALAFVEENARRNGVPTPDVRFVDWRETYPELRPERIIAAEVTYEARNLAPIAVFIRQHLADNGFALLVDRNRQVADPFPEQCRREGLAVEVVPAERPGLKAGEVIAGRFFRVTRQGSGVPRG